VTLRGADSERGASRGSEEFEEECSSVKVIRVVGHVRRGAFRV